MYESILKDCIIVAILATTHDDSFGDINRTRDYLVSILFVDMAMAIQTCYPRTPYGIYILVSKIDTRPCLILVHDVIVQGMSYKFHI
jgi:hypothetical protein